MHFVVAGYGSAEALADVPPDPRCTLYESPPDLGPLYDAASVVVTPVRMGGGTRIKILEALGHGRAVVSTSFAAEGLGLRGGIDLEFAHTPGDIAAVCLQLLRRSAPLARRGAEWRSACTPAPHRRVSGLMIIDEIGYLPITRTGAMLFQLLTRRYEHASTILTSNKGFEDWGEIFGDEAMAAALIDRLVHHCHIVNIRGNSYRLRQHAELARRLHAASRPATERKPNRQETPPTA